MLREASRDALTEARLVATLGVRDVAVSTAFYARVVGLRISRYSQDAVTLAEPWSGRDVLRLVEVPWAPGRAGGRLRQLVFGFGASADVTLARALAQVQRAGAAVRSHGVRPEWEEVSTQDPNGFVVTLALRGGDAPQRRAFADEGLGGPIRIAGLHVHTSCLESATSYWSQVLGIAAEPQEGASVLRLADGHPGLVLHQSPEHLIASPLDLRALDVAGAARAPAAADPDGLSGLRAA